MIDINNDYITNEIKAEEKIYFFLDALNNTMKYEALPNEIKMKLQPYRDKLQKGESLTVYDYRKIKEAII